MTNEHQPDHTVDAEPRAPIGLRIGSGSKQYPLEPTTIGSEVYTDTRQFSQELKQIFKTDWLLVAPSDELERPGEYLVWDRLGESVVVVRGEHGDLHAFHNVCQHRGMKIVKHGGLCTSGRFTCPWHGFSYDMSGKLATAPLPETFNADDLQDLRAPGVWVEEWNGLIWLSLSEAEPTSRRNSLGSDFADDLGAYKLGEAWTFAREGTWHIGANWKTCVDAFNETWHVPFTHRDSVRGALLWKEAAAEIHGRHSMMVIPLRRKMQAGHYPTDDHHGHMLCHYMVFPNVIFNCFPTMLEAFVATPSGPDSTRLDAYFFVNDAEEMSEAQVEAGWQNFCEVVAEDVAILNQAGSVAHSSGYRRNLFNTAESRLSAFHGAVAEITGSQAPKPTV